MRKTHLWRSSHKGYCLVEAEEAPGSGWHGVEPWILSCTDHLSYIFLLLPAPFKQINKSRLLHTEHKSLKWQGQQKVRVRVLAEHGQGIGMAEGEKHARRLQVVAQSPTNISQK